MPCYVHRSYRIFHYSFSINNYHNNTHKGKSIIALFSFFASNSAIECSRNSSSSSSLPSNQFLISIETLKNYLTQIMSTKMIKFRSWLEKIRDCLLIEIWGLPI
ncbi:hypothetical protein Syun_004705 [Stephania yunnanensis]|uniref:Uncharacterized protein n=1 Tax=Stephania yunnanensis TaxID=152371 RepID=A0AAP0L4Z2_9MAGN